MGRLIDRKKWRFEDFSYQVKFTKEGMRYMQIVHIPSQRGWGFKMRYTTVDADDVVVPYVWNWPDILLFAAWYRDKLIQELENARVEW